MGRAREVVERYFEAFGAKEAGWKEMVTDDVRFTGPLQQARGIDEFVQLGEQLLQTLQGTRLRARFEDGDRVCSIMEFDLVTPAGEALTCLVSELATVRDGKVADFEVIYDPRKIAEAYEAP